MLNLIKDEKTQSLFKKTMVMILASKILTIASPWFLKGVVDSMALGTNVNLNAAFLGIGAFGITRFLASYLHDARLF